jgi:prolyl-tRNA editing enzyme YbaK/EbsC (Cys-tRNA(Pro) deacylase)
LADKRAQLLRGWTSCTGYASRRGKARLAGGSRTGSGVPARVGAESRIEEFSDGTPTAEDAAKAVGCDLAQIVKSLVFDCDGRSILVLVPGDRRADRAKVSAAAGCSKARIAGAEQVRNATGYEPGAVAPFPVRQVEAVFLDRSLLGHPIVWIGAGTTRHMAALAPTELMRLSRAEPMDAVESRPEGPVSEADQGRGSEGEPAP